MRVIAGSLLAVLLAHAATASAQSAPGALPPPFAAGEPLGVVVDGVRTPISPNVKVYGAVVNAESCVYDAGRKLILAVNRGANQNEVPNDGFVSLINPDGSVHTPRWIGQTRAGLVLNHPFGSDIHKGQLYLADRDGGVADGTPSVSVLRRFDLRTGAPTGQIVVPESTGFNDIAVAADGTVYASQTGGGEAKLPMRIYKVLQDGRTSVLIEGAPLSSPNGVGLDPAGNLVVLNMGDDRVLTFSPQGRLLRTERAAQPGSDGLVILPDGTKYVSSVRQGGVSRIRPGEPAELIARGIPSAASMCFDSDSRRLVIPMNPNNALAFISIE
ncbi:MAG: SMP-30/gluconolactonase/LRE family protein [Proteobacteria bacterium]|nr:SMP-30/gluconolactonase/LRE family protein [Pseudomonadota bacterium]